MSYESVVLALNPVFYARLDALSGTEILDISGNNNHGVYSPATVFGLDSPIQTDASSRANNSAVGYVPAPEGSQLDLVSAFTLMGWSKFQPSLDAALWARNGSANQTSSNWVGINLNNIHCRLAPVFGTTHFLDYSQTLTEGAWYFIVVTRNTNVIRLYANAVLRDEDTGFQVGDISYPFYNQSSWKIGEARNSVTASEAHGNFQFADGTDEPALFDYALTASQILEVYEAALATLPLSATIYVRFPVELETDQIIPVEFPFTHNFADAISGQPNPFTEVLSYKTNVNQSEPDYQQRVNAQPHHVERTLEYHVTAVGLQRSRLQAALWTPGDVYPIPIPNDWGTLTAQATAGASTLSLDTTLKDYEVGSYVGVWGNVFDASTYQQFQITSRTDTEIGITPNVGTTIPIGSPVMPARLACLPDEDLSVKSHMIDRETAVLQFEVLSTELSSRRVTAYTPGATYLSIEVFNLERAKVEWLDPASYQIGRRMMGTGTPTGNDYQRAIDTGSPQTVPIRVLLTTRQAISDFYGWMDARQGKQNPVWVMGQDADLVVTARTSSSITITHIGYTSRYNVHGARRHIAFLKTDGSYVYKMISNAVDNGDGTETLSVSSPPTLATIAKVSFLRFCTAPDRFELRYHRNGNEFICESEFVMTELLTTPD